MAISVFDMFKVGIGPSSSHTVGPMVAATRFINELVDLGLFASVKAVKVQLRGSLSATGKGHGTDAAVLAGLGGGWPETVDPTWVTGIVAQTKESKTLVLANTSGSVSKTIPFDYDGDLEFASYNCQIRDPHPNAMTLWAFDETGTEIARKNFYSIGGGFIATDETVDKKTATATVAAKIPYPFRTASELLGHCSATQLSIAQLVLANEAAIGRDEAEVTRRMHRIWDVMHSAIERGRSTEGVLPGGLKVRRRAPLLAKDLQSEEADPLSVMDRVSVWAIAVNEENAAGGRVVTAPTNGAAGIIPAVLNYSRQAKAVLSVCDDPIRDFLLTAGAIGTIYQQTASISGAEVGCQGEVGVASSMAAAGLAQVRGGSPEQVCNAAEIGLEHHLGLTCDPVGGLVQVPCIERNAVGAVTAITAARLALAGDGRQLVSLDQVMETMMATGSDMMSKYKETSTGGLAVSLAEC
ncbi:L-serine ammonia-lyase [Propionimicrobium lymphophilum]|uniref:L-serine ammonia-lyase n=1 Tax=Propionimicrobium lymphophilum TaxID=33012 RepID=UPI0023F1A848|nr:L-serine ammonia-lyase [Propionimicrobium lymphophilum]